jgi:hypothetical protein
MAGIALLLVVMMSRLRKGAKRRATQDNLFPAERIAALRERAEAEGGIEGRVAHAADQIRELTAVLDTRIATLDALIQQADERIDALREPKAGPSHEHSREPATTPADAQKRAIYDLADQGLTPEEIAGRLGQHAGKVELVLALRRV